MAQLIKVTAITKNGRLDQFINPEHVVAFGDIAYAIDPSLVPHAAGAASFCSVSLANGGHIAVAGTAGALAVAIETLHRDPVLPGVSL